MVKSLEEITERALRSWGRQLPQYISLDDFETKIRRIARAYGGRDTVLQEGSHRKIKILDYTIKWAPRQRGHESVVSSGVFSNAINDIAGITNIPSDQLELYFKGSGKPYKRFKKVFEREYDI